MLVPSFAGDGSEQVIVVEAREIAKVEAHLAAFAAALEHDPRSPAPELPEFDASADEAVPYEMRSTPERQLIDLDFVPPVTVNRETTDSKLLAEQIEGAVAAHEAEQATG